MQFNVRSQLGFEDGVLIRAEQPQRVERCLILLFLRNHKVLSRCLNLSSPRRIRALTVPSGCPSRAAISWWLRCSKKANSIASRCSEGKLFNTYRTRTASSFFSAVSAALSTVDASAATVVDESSVEATTTRERRPRARNRSITRLRVSSTVQLKTLLCSGS